MGIVLKLTFIEAHLVGQLIKCLTSVFRQICEHNFSVSPNFDINTFDRIAFCSHIKDEIDMQRTASTCSYELLDELEIISSPASFYCTVVESRD